MIKLWANEPGPHTQGCGPGGFDPGAAGWVNVLNRVFDSSWQTRLCHFWVTRRLRRREWPRYAPCTSGTRCLGVTGCVPVRRSAPPWRLCRCQCVLPGPGLPSPSPLTATHWPVTSYIRSVSDSTPEGPRGVCLTCCLTTPWGSLHLHMPLSSSPTSHIPAWRTSPAFLVRQVWWW